MDFMLTAYQFLISTLLERGYVLQPLVDFMQNRENRSVILRHDVDRLPENALKMAGLEHEMGVEATYYFRAMPASWNEGIIREVVSFGHEVGYHNENLATCKGDFGLAIDDFGINLKKLRKLYPVKTMCMHGSPLSRWDNRDLWKKYDYRDYGIIAEPYFDVDFEEVLYLTDTGRRWDGDEVSVRDKVRGQRTEDGGRMTET